MQGIIYIQLNSANNTHTCAYMCMYMYICANMYVHIFAYMCMYGEYIPYLKYDCSNNAANVFHIALRYARRLPTQNL